jgi:hypothetical protein
MRIATTLIYIMLLTAAVSARPVLTDPTEQIGRAFLEALKAGDFKKLKGLTPALRVWRKLFPVGSKKLTDEELMKALEKNYYPKLRKDFDAIMESARERKIGISRLEFVEARLHKQNGEETITGMAVFYRYGEKDGRFSLTVIRMEGGYYLSEILLSYDVFRGIAVE